MTLRERIRRLAARTARIAFAADCRLPDCTICRPTAPPPDVVAEIERCLDVSGDSAEVGRAFWWLLDTFPEIWQTRSFARRLEVAERVARLRVRVRTERTGSR